MYFSFEFISEVLWLFFCSAGVPDKAYAEGLCWHQVQSAALWPVCRWQMVQDASGGQSYVQATYHQQQLGDRQPCQEEASSEVWTLVPKGQFALWLGAGQQNCVPLMQGWVVGYLSLGAFLCGFVVTDMRKGLKWSCTFSVLQWWARAELCWMTTDRNIFKSPAHSFVHACNTSIVPPRKKPVIRMSSLNGMQLWLFQKEKKDL